MQSLLGQFYSRIKHSQVKVAGELYIGLKTLLNETEDNVVSNLANQLEKFYMEFKDWD